MKFKIGDELVCYSVCRMRDNGHRVITKYKVYPIIGFHDNNMLLCIKDDDGDCHYWSIIKGSASYYGEREAMKIFTPRKEKTEKRETALPCREPLHSFNCDSRS